MKFPWLKVVFFTTAMAAQSSVSAQAYIDSPQGQYPVGTRSIDLVDAERQVDPLAPQGSEGPRRIHVKFWYPAKRYGCQRSHYFPESGSYVANFIDVSKQMFPLTHEELAQMKQLHYLKSYAYEDASIRKVQPWHHPQGWPVILYSHGSSLHERDNVEMLENLASHGYMVVSINHTYVSSITEFKNGDIIYRNSELDDASPELFNLISDNIAQDSVAVYNKLPLLNELLFDNTLDLNTLGTVGYSLGGSNAVNACLALASCKAAVHLDGTQFGTAANVPLGKPLLLFESATHDRDNDDLDRLFDNQTADTMLLTVDNTNHFDFFDLTRWVDFPLTQADPSHIHQLVKSNVLSFFETYVAESSGYYDIQYPESIKIRRK